MRVGDEPDGTWTLPGLILGDALARLETAALIEATGRVLELRGTARLFESTVTYGFLVERVRLPDPRAPAIADALHVYRSGRSLIVTRPIGDGDSPMIECQQVNRRQLADMILTLTLDSDELAAIDTE